MVNFAPVILVCMLAGPPPVNPLHYSKDMPKDQVDRLKSAVPVLPAEPLKMKSLPNIDRDEFMRLWSLREEIKSDLHALGSAKGNPKAPLDMQLHDAMVDMGKRQAAERPLHQTVPRLNTESGIGDIGLFPSITVSAIRKDGILCTTARGPMLIVSKRHQWTVGKTYNPISTIGQVFDRIETTTANGDQVTMLRVTEMSF